MTATIIRVQVFVTSDLSIEFSVFDHPGKRDVPAAAWKRFAAAWKHAHGSEIPGNGSIAAYAENAMWQWDEVYSDGTVVIGDRDSPLALEDEPSGPEGCRIVFWDEGTAWDTGLRVWAGETRLITRLLRSRDR